MRLSVCIPAAGDRALISAFLSVLTRILEQMSKWAELGKMRSFVKQTEIRMELDKSYRELQTCSMRFNVRRQSLYLSHVTSSLTFTLACRSLCICMQPARAKNSRRFADAITMNSSR